MAGATYPTKYKGNDIIPLEGKSLVPIFKNGHREGHDYLGFEHYNERAFLSNDGWKLVRPGENAKWELYNLNEDRSEMHNLAAQHPEKVAEMTKAYEAWAKRCMVEPYPGHSIDYFIKDSCRNIARYLSAGVFFICLYTIYHTSPETGG